MSEAIQLPGLRCPNCGRIAYDEGGGRACHSPETHQRCGVMQPIWLRAVPDGERDSRRCGCCYREKPVAGGAWGDDGDWYCAECVA